ncbi:uncharacterized protein VTP21DRAFT_5012 [Calcarisporiella thermophila]|uniref:uncharacterized protein n=1 Tax=Calcarisporiella thermophila TaxID=911321 RepID=UPI00374382ED
MSQIEDFDPMSTDDLDELMDSTPSSMVSGRDEIIGRISRVHERIVHSDFYNDFEDDFDDEDLK